MKDLTELESYTRIEIKAGKSNMDKWEYGFSKYLNYKNQSVSWLPSDTKELYDYNLKHNYSELEKHGWIDVDIKYSFNEYGFRSDSFQKDCTILFNGCSQTMGIGIPLDMMWSKIIADHYADPEQGSGAVKITPAHDFNDYEVGKRNNLDIINIFENYS